MRHEVIGVTVLALAVASACGDDVAPDGAFPEARLLQRLEVGEIDGQLAFDRITEILPGPANQLYVLEGQRGRVTVLDEEGRFVRRFGRRGAGPGEFSLPVRMGWHGDTLWVHDRRADRFTLFDAEGELLSVISPQIRAREGLEPPVRPFALMRDHRMLGRTRPSASAIALGEVTSVPYALLDRDGRVLRTIFEVDPRPVLWVHNPSSENPLSGSYGAQPWARAQPVAWDAASQTFVRVVEEGEVATIEAIDLEGRVVSIGTVKLRPRPLPRDTVRRFIQRMAEDFARSPAAEGARASRIEGWVEDAVRVPDALPSVEAVLVGPDGSIWIEKEDEEGHDWLVVDLEGRGRARAPAPADFTAIAAREDGLVGIRTDELDIPYVVAYTLEWP